MSRGDGDQMIARTMVGDRWTEFYRDGTQRSWGRGQDKSSAPRVRPSPPQLVDGCISAAQAAALMGVNEGSLRREIQQGRLYRQQPGVHGWTRAEIGMLGESAWMHANQARLSASRPVVESAADEAGSWAARRRSRLCPIGIHSFIEVTRRDEGSIIVSGQACSCGGAREIVRKVGLLGSRVTSVRRLAAGSFDGAARA